MSDVKDAGVVIPASGVTPAAPPVEPPVDQVSGGKTYNEDFVNKVLNEKKNAMVRLKQLEDEKKQSEETRLLEQNKWKEIAEIREKDLQTVQQKHQELQNKIVSAKKEQALKNELRKRGCLDKYVDKSLAFAKMDSIKIDEETGVVYGVESVAEGIQMEYDVFFSSNAPKVTHQAPGLGVQKFDMETFKKMSLDDQRKNMRQFYEANGLFLKS